jgi:hypothetical protein
VKITVEFQGKSGLFGGFGLNVLSIIALGLLDPKFVCEIAINGLP